MFLEADAATSAFWAAAACAHATTIAVTSAKGNVGRLWFRRPAAVRILDKSAWGERVLAFARTNKNVFSTTRNWPKALVFICLITRTASGRERTSMYRSFRRINDSSRTRRQRPFSANFPGQNNGDSLTAGFIRALRISSPGGCLPFPFFDKVERDADHGLLPHAIICLHETHLAGDDMVADGQNRRGRNFML